MPERRRKFWGWGWEGEGLTREELKLLDPYSGAASRTVTRIIDQACLLQPFRDDKEFSQEYNKRD